MTLLRMLRSAGARVRNRLRPPPQPVSTRYEIMDTVPAEGTEGWRTRAVAERQHQAFEPLLEAARRGEPRVDFQVAARAVAATGLDAPSLVEVGCGSGYYSEILPRLSGRPVAYLGIDYSPHMVALAREKYPEARFLCGDARSLPLAHESYDIVMSGTSLMHIVEWRETLAESARVARGWVIVHSVPVLERRPTTLLRKHAYGEPVMEVVFNRGELETALTDLGLTVVETHEVIPYNLIDTLHEPTYTLTYLCRKH